MAHKRERNGQIKTTAPSLVGSSEGSENCLDPGHVHGDSRVLIWVPRSVSFLSQPYSCRVTVFGLHSPTGSRKNKAFPAPIQGRLRKFARESRVCTVSSMLRILSVTRKQVPGFLPDAFPHVNRISGEFGESELPPCAIPRIPTLLQRVCVIAECELANR